ncbi:hypothetical protein DKT75_13845 [Leucothrix arctica]|uniref:Glycosyltransferase family 1 protein n=1 Tax=Leucothrix arctica TaxID=1481894 RepID=A0A317CFQ3_9GAMM|nr:hypothetical protein DKT75_13845 [Leucothrix arctica]
MEDASFRYRCENLSAGLNQLNIDTKLQHISEFKLEASTTHVVFQRPRNTPRLKRLIRQLKLAKVRTIADFDDLVFDPEYATVSPAILNNRRPLRQVTKDYKSHYDALVQFKRIIVSTNTLKRHVQRLIKGSLTHIIHNYAHYKWPYKQPQHPEQRKKVLTYFPGTRSHDRDFWQIEDVLSTFIKQHADVSLLIIGPLETKLLNTPHPQIKHIAKLPFEQFAQAAAKSWVNLLPLEPTPFNQNKSALKVIEAATNLAPTICSPLPDAQRFVGHGVLIAHDDTEWLKHLTHCLDPENYLKLVHDIHHSAKGLQHAQMARAFCLAFNISLDH